VQELGGWSSLGLVQRYAHLSPGHKAEALERLCAAQNSPTNSRQLSRAIWYCCGTARIPWPPP